MIRHRVLTRSATGFFALLLALAVTTWLALEAGGVGVIETTRADGEVRRTRVWLVEIEGERWLGAGAATNGWYRDIIERPEIRLLPGEGRALRFHATPVPTPAAQQRLRRALRHRYGWRDRWLALFITHTQSIPIRLTPTED